MAEEPVPEWRKPMNYPLVVQSDLTDDLQTEALDLVVSVIERTQGNLEACVKSLKEDMDKKTGPGWNAVVGEGFSHYITYTTNILFLYFAGNTGVLLWK
jgi:dynein light chain 4